MTEAGPFWRKCSMCKEPIAFLQAYWVCNVSTCNRKRTGLIFCNVACFDAHVPMMNHRESWAEERHAPSQKEWKEQQEAPAPARAPRRKSAPDDAATEAEAPAPSEKPASAAAKPKTVILRRSSS